MPNRPVGGESLAQRALSAPAPYSAQWSSLLGAPIVTVSAVGTAAGFPMNDGSNFGPDTKGTTTNGINEALNTTFSVRIVSGHFFISTPLIPAASGQEIYGVGRDYTTISLMNASNCDMVDIASSVLEVTVADLTLDGNKANQTGGTAMANIGYTGASGSCWRTRLLNVKMLNAFGIGINAPNSGANQTLELILEHIDMESPGGVGILDNTADSFFADINIQSAGAQGWYHTGTDAHLIGVHVTSSANNAFQIAGGNSAHLWGCIADTSANHGFVLGGTTAILMNCQAYNCGQASPGSFNGFVFAGSFNQLIGCQETDSTAHTLHAVNEASGGNNLVSGGYMHDATGLLIVTTSPFTLVRDVGSYNPVGFGVTTPGFPLTTAEVQNTTGVIVCVRLLTSGTMTVYTIRDTAGTLKTFTCTPLAGWSFRLVPGEKISFTFSAPATWVWEGE